MKWGPSPTTCSDSSGSHHSGGGGGRAAAHEHEARGDGLDGLAATREQAASHELGVESAAYGHRRRRPCAGHRPRSGLPQPPSLASAGAVPFRVRSLAGPLGRSRLGSQQAGEGFHQLAEVGGHERGRRIGDGFPTRARSPRSPRRARGRRASRGCRPSPRRCSVDRPPSRPGHRIVPAPVRRSGGRACPRPRVARRPRSRPRRRSRRRPDHAPGNRIGESRFGGDERAPARIVARRLDEDPVVERPGSGRPPPRRPARDRRRSIRHRPPPRATPALRTPAPALGWQRPCEQMGGGQRGGEHLDGVRGHAHDRSLATTSPTATDELLDRNATRSPAARQARHAVDGRYDGLRRTRQITPSRSRRTTGTDIRARTSHRRRSPAAHSRSALWMVGPINMSAPQSSTGTTMISMMAASPPQAEVPARTKYGWPSFSNARPSPNGGNRSARNHSTATTNSHSLRGTTMR